MEKWLFGLCLATAGLAHAQQSVLMDACNALKDPGMRLDCFREATQCQSGIPEQKPLSKLKEIVIGMQSAIEGGLTLGQYEALLLEFSRELGLYKSKQPPDEVVALLDQAAEAYRDADTFWRSSISRGGSGLLLQEDMADLSMGTFIAKYSIPLTKKNWNLWVSREDGVSAMWAYAKNLTDKAFVLAE